MLKDIRVKTQHGERLTKVIVLKESKEGIVYIPLNAIARIDYDRLTELYYRTKDKMDLLEALHEERLDNGRNGLVVYKDIIRNKSYHTGTAVEKGKTTNATIEDPNIAVPTETKEEPKPPEGYEKSDEKPKKRGPGRPPKNKSKEPQNVEFPDDD